MKKRIIIMNIIIALTTKTALAHGEDKAGPNGGHIKMPANFHTELLVLPNNQLKIFLLDIELKNATNEKSSVKVFYKAKRRQTNLKCSSENNYFICKGLPENFKGSVFVNARRLEVQANLNAEYELPLAEFKNSTGVKTPDNNKNNHHQHH